LARAIQIASICRWQRLPHFGSRSPHRSWLD